MLSATIDRYAYASLSPRKDGQISIESIDYGTSLDFGVSDPLHFDGKLDLVKAAIRRLGGAEQDGYDLLLRSNVPPGSGLGSSSTLMVCLIGLLNSRYRLALTDYQIAELAYTLEREDLGIAGGLQDQYAAVFGGFNFIEFEAERVIVNPLRIRQELVNELQHNMLLCDTGMTRASAQIIEDQTARFVSGSSDTVEGLWEQRNLAVEMKNALLRGNLPHFGELLGVAWDQKKRMSPKITTEMIDETYSIARKSGAIGGKVTGAGGGGHLLIYCDSRSRHRVASALEKKGVSLVDFSFVSDGMVTWSAPRG